MASIIKEFTVSATADTVWAALRNVGAAHRLFPGVVTETTLEEGARVVRFANGMIVRELIVALDDERRRFAYAVVGGSLRHHNASFEVAAEGNGSRIRWVTDLLPDEMAGAIADLVDHGATAMAAAMARQGN